MKSKFYGKHIVRTQIKTALLRGQVREIVTSATGHRAIAQNEKSNHSNNIIIFLHIPTGSKYHILLRFTQSRRHQSTPPPPPLAQSPPRSFQPPAPCHRPFSSAFS